MLPFLTKAAIFVIRIKSKLNECNQERVRKMRKINQKPGQVNFIRALMESRVLVGEASNRIFPSDFFRDSISS